MSLHVGLLIAALLGVGGQAAAPPVAPQTDALAQAYFFFLQGKLAEGQGDAAGALAAYQKGLALQPQSAGLHAEIASLYARTGRATDAINEAEAALKSEPANRMAHRVLGFVQAAIAEMTTDAAKQGALVKNAIGHFEKALAGGASDLGSELTLGRLYIQTGDYDKGIAVLNLFLAEQPDYAEAVLLIADAYEATHKIPEAIGAMEPLVAHQPADTKARQRLAELYEDANRWRDASNAWGELARRNPQISTFRKRRAIAAVNGGDYETARTEVTALSADAPRDAALWYLRAQIERRAGQPAAAEDAARHITEIDPADVRGPIALADAKLARQDTAGAIDVLVEAKKKMPDSVDLSLMLASTYDRSGKIDEAEATYRAVITKDPINAGALNDLSYMLAVRGRKLDEAVSLAQRAVAIDNANPSFLDTLGWAFYKSGKSTDARAPLEQAAAKTPSGSVILDHLADVYFELKLYKDAAGAWDKSLAGDREGIDVAAVTYKRDKARQLAGR